MKQLLINLFAATFILVLAHNALAAQVLTVKDKRVLVDISDVEALEGDDFYLMSSENKRVGIIKLTKVKNQKALADLLKGRAEVGMTLKPRTNPLATKDSYTTEPALKSSTSASNFRVKKHNMGLMLNVLMNTMNADEQDANGVKETAAMKGNSFGAAGFFDYAFSPSLSIRAMAGLDQYTASSQISILGCASKTSQNCDVNISYLTGTAYVKYNLTLDNWRWHLLGGSSLMFAMSKKSTALKESEISMNQVFLFGGGVDIKLSGNNFIPISIEYGLFPPSTDVKASTIYIRGGYAWIF